MKSKKMDIWIIQAVLAGNWEIHFDFWPSEPIMRTKSFEYIKTQNLKMQLLLMTHITDQNLNAQNYSRWAVPHDFQSFAKPPIVNNSAHSNFDQMICVINNNCIFKFWVFMYSNDLVLMIGSLQYSKASNGFYSPQDMNRGLISNDIFCL